MKNTGIKQTLKKRSLKIFKTLDKVYPGAGMALNFSTNWQLLLATILSAQCTDKRVNLITAELFRDYPDLSDYLNMSSGELIRYIRPAGFFNNKAKNILGAAKLIQNDFQGRIPDTMDDMLRIPGVARKTANVVLGNAYGIYEGIAVDTHVKRLSGRLGFSAEKTPEKVEKDLMLLFPRDKWFRLTYLLIEHGRALCRARKAECGICPLSELCPRIGIR